jgi:hypothetical protein
MSYAELTEDDAVRRGTYVKAIGYVIANPQTRASLANACMAVADAELHDIKRATLHKAAAMLRRTSGPNPAEDADFDGYDVHMVQEAALWDGTMGAADTLDEYADMVRPL